EREAHHGAERRELTAQPPPTNIRVRDDPRNADDHRDGREGPEVFHRVEGAVELLREYHQATRQRGGQREAEDQEAPAVGGRRRRRRDGGLRDPELLALLALLQALRELRIFVALQERPVEVARGIVVARELLQLEVALGRVLDARL